MIVLQHAYTYGISICEARRFTEDEKKEYSEWFRDIGFCCISESENLHYVTWHDLPKRSSDGCFLGCGNCAWILTAEEADYYRALEKSRASEEREKAEAAEHEKAERHAQAEAEKESIRSKIDHWDVSELAPHKVKHTLSVNGETLTFLERDVFDVGIVINPDYSIASGLKKGGMHNINKDGVPVWETFRDGEGWYEVRHLTENEAICIKAISKMGKFSRNQIRM